jgi:protein arginine kinase
MNPDIPFLFNEEDKDADTVIQTSISLQRNLSSYNFPHKLEEGDKIQVEQEIQALVKTELPELSLKQLGSIEPLRRKVYLERGYFGNEYSLRSNNLFAENKDLSVTATFNNENHIHCIGMAGGSDLSGIMQRIKHIDNTLDSAADFAADPEFGYLLSRPEDSGNGLIPVILIHVPGLSKTGILEKIWKKVLAAGFNITGYFGAEEDGGSLGDLYKIRPETSYGQSQKQIKDNLENVIKQLVHYERKARDELYQSERISIEDKVYRSYGILSHCRLISLREAIEHISNLRLGAYLKLVPVKEFVCSKLFFGVQKSHLLYSLNGEESGESEQVLDYTRAEYIRNLLAR